jgi:hypothetical protein
VGAERYTVRSKIEEAECTFVRKAKIREKFGGGN